MAKAEATRLRELLETLCLPGDKDFEGEAESTLQRWFYGRRKDFGLALAIECQMRAIDTLLPYHPSLHWVSDMLCQLPMMSDAERQSFWHRCAHCDELARPNRSILDGLFFLVGAAGSDEHQEWAKCLAYSVLQTAYGVHSALWALRYPEQYEAWNAYSKAMDAAPEVIGPNEAFPQFNVDISNIDDNVCLKGVRDVLGPLMRNL